MTTKEILYKFDLESDKMDSQDFPDLPLPSKLLVLNKGILMYVEACAGINNIFRQGLEETQMRIDQLEVLIDKEQPDIDYIKSTIEQNCFVADYSDIISNYLHYARTISYADKDSCTNRIMYNDIVRHSELNEVLKDEHRIGNFEWQRLPILQASNKFYAYTDGTFTPKKIHIDFLKRPTKIDLSGYTHIDGTPSSDVDSELPDEVLERVITLTAKFLKTILGDPIQAKALEVEVTRQD